MSLAQPLKPDHVTATPIGQRTSGRSACQQIGGLGVELADVAGNLQEVAGRVSNQSERFGHLQKTAETMVSANHGIASASRCGGNRPPTAAVGEITQSRAAVETLVGHIAELIEAVGRIERRLVRSEPRFPRSPRYPGYDRGDRQANQPAVAEPRPSRPPAPATRAEALRWSPAK